MKKISDRDLSFLIKAAAFSLLFLAFLHVISPLIDPNRDQITAATNALVPLSSSELSLRLSNDEGRPALLFIYASWCGYCKQVMPEILQLMRDKKLDGVNTVFLSLDDRRRSLGQYIFTHAYGGLYTPYIYQKGQSLVGLLGSRGSSFTGAIPYIAVFDAAGNLKAEDDGVINRARIMGMVFQAQ